MQKTEFAKQNDNTNSDALQQTELAEEQKRNGFVLRCNENGHVSVKL